MARKPPSIFDRIAANVTAATTVPKTKKKGGAGTPPRRQRARSTWNPSDDARVWAAEQALRPEDRLVPKHQIPKKPRTFAEAMGQRPLSWQEREALRRARVEWAKEAILPDQRGVKARKKLAATMTPDRQRDLLKRDLGQPGRVVDQDALNRQVAKSKIEKRIRTTKDKDERRRLQFALQAIEHPGFNPLRWTAGAIEEGLGGVAGVLQQGVSGAGRVLLSDKERRELSQYLQEVMEDTARYSEAASDFILPKAYEKAERQQAGVGGFGQREKRIAAASIRTAIGAAIGLGPGLVYMAGNPKQAYDEYLRYIRSYYGPLLRGDVRPLEEQGLTPGLLDVLGVASAGLGTAGRVGALGRTARFRGPLRLSSEGRLISRPEAYGRAALLRQEPVPILGTETTTMGRRVPERMVGREEPVREGTIEEGDRVEYRVGEEVRTTRASEENGLAGLDAPDANNPIHRQVHGEDAEVLNAYRMGEFEQRMVPRSPVGQFISDLYNRLRPDTQRERGILSGKGRRTKLVRERMEVEEDRFRGQIKAFMKDAKSVQKNVVSSTAYDRMLRYRDPATQIPQEIAARRQRGLDVSREQKQVLAALEQAQELVANPSPELQAAVIGGRMLSADTEAFLISRGLLSPQRALTAKLAAERWLKPGHLKDEPLSSPRRTQVEAELREHFHRNEDATNAAMAYTDTLARAWGERTGRDPAEWYEANIREVRTVEPEQMDVLAAQPGMLRQERYEIKRTPRQRELIPFRDPETGDMRVARVVEVGWEGEALGREIDLAEAELARARESAANPRGQAVLDENGNTVEAPPSEAYLQTLAENVTRAERNVTALRGRMENVDAAVIEWAQGPDAGTRLTVPLDSIRGITSRLNGWYSGLANEVEKLPEKMSKQELTSRLQKAPGVKKDEWKWMGMDRVIETLFPPGVKSVSRDDVRKTMSYNTLRFTTEKLSREEAYYETTYDVTLPGPRSDYSETLVYWPERHMPWDESDWRAMQESEYEYQYESHREMLDAAVESGDMTPEEAEADMASFEPYDVEIEQEPPLYEAPHFGEHPAYRYSDEGLSYSGNLIAHRRDSDRWLGGSPITVIEEMQSDWHQAGRKGYATAEKKAEAEKAEAAATAAREQQNEARREYLSAFVKKLRDQDIHVRSIVSGEEGNVLRDAYGETPEFRIELQAAQEAVGNVPVAHPWHDLAEGDVVWTAAGKKGKVERDEQGLLFRYDDGTPYRPAPRADFYFHDPTEIDYRPAQQALTERRNIRDIEPTSDADLRDLFEVMRERDAEYEDAAATARNVRSRAYGPPEAPWQGEGWEQLLFRDAVREAVANGETRIAWTTGAQQAQRYNELLAQNVRRLEWDGDTLHVTDTGGGTHHYDAYDQDKLTDLVGNALASKLVKQRSEALEAAGPWKADIFRVERPAGEGYRTETMYLPLSETRQGDVVWVGGASNERGRMPHGFRVSEEQGTRYFSDSQGYWPPLDPWEYEGYMPAQTQGRWEGAEFGQAARRIQTDQYRDYGERSTGAEASAVLEGEDITVGGGGFIDAYDRRLPKYAKKYLGVEARKEPLDAIRYDEITGSDPSHPEYEAVFTEFNRLIEAEGEEVSANVLAEAAIRDVGALPVYRVWAGDQVLAESESLQAALQSAYLGGKDAGHWPSRIRRVEGGYASFMEGAAPGETKPSWSKQRTPPVEDPREAVHAVERAYMDNWISDFDNGVKAVEGAGPVWVVDIPESFATQLHEKGSPLFQRRRGSILGLARLTDEGANIYLDRTAADMATWVEEAGHAAIPGWLEEADARFDPRANYVREKLGVGLGEQLNVAAHEKAVRFLQVWLMEGSMPGPQQRSLRMAISAEMRKGLEGASAKVVKDAAERKEFDRWLADPEMTSFFRDAFDVAPYKDLDAAPIFFQTMKTQGRVARGPGKLQRTVRSILPSRTRMAKHPNTMRAFESGNFDVGPDMTAHYANAELRTRMQDEQARRVLRYQEPIEVVNGVPTLKSGYQVYNYYAVRRANARIDEMFRRSNRYGDIETSEEPLLSPDPTTGGILDMEPEDFTDFAEEVVASILKEEALYDSIGEAEYAIGERFLELIREGKVGQIPVDVAETFLNASGAGFSLASTNTALRLVMTGLRVPSMLARWRMVGKLAYPITNTAFTGLLVGVNQLPVLPVNIYRSYWPGQLGRSTRIRLLQEVGVGTAELVDVPELIGRNRIERWQAKEQGTFRKVMHFMSTPEAHVRMWQMVNDLADAGYRTDADITRLLDLVKEGDEGATRLLNQVGRNAEDGVVRFRGMTPDEQIFVRDVLFVYGWLRSAARFTLRFPLERPVTAAAMFHIGQYGWEKLQEDFYSLAWEQQGAIPIGKRRDGEETMVKLLDLSQAFPFKSGIELLRIPAQYLGLLETGLRPASFADLLSPSAETALRAIYGQDPRYATGFWEGMKYDADPRNLPGVFWISRLIDPSLTGTKLRGDRSRWNVLINLFAGQVAPYEVKQSVEYERWLDQQPSDIRTLIREQNDAEAFARIGEAAYKTEGGTLSMEQIRAINADSAYGIYTGLLQSKRRRDKNDSGYYLTSLERSASKAKMLEAYFPDAYADAAGEVAGLDPVHNDQDAETYSQVMDDAWEESVSDVKSEIRTAVKDNLGFEMPESTKVPFNRWQRDLRWLQTAPPESVRRIKAVMERQHVTANNTLALAPIIEDEMRRMVKP